MIGDKIKAYLQANGISQTFLAKKANMKLQTINDICTHGRRVDAVEYYQICKALNLPLGTILEEE
jgi:transcriptional regulator with XRE-family HTH domain